MVSVEEIQQTSKHTMGCADFFNEFLFDLFVELASMLEAWLI
jgi:hypothetical protein